MGARVAGVGLLTGWGEGPGALPDDAVVAAAGRAVLPLGRPSLDSERFRRATRECLLGVAAVNAMLADAGLERDAIRGQGTALLFVTAAAYAASNAEFVAGAASPARTVGGLSEERRGAAGTLHFPYTAPSALSGEVAIEFGLTGAYVILVGGAPAAIDALWQASLLLAQGRCQRALVLVVETFAECEALWRRARWTLPPPLVETAACALLEAGDTAAVYRAVAAGSLPTAAERRAGRTLAAEPLVALALARAAGEPAVRLTGSWRGRTAGIDLAVAGHAARV
ncbi:MAG TPA: beta-ketoacyl synthase N-terminal-like domain-containing protein [Methylomirabilota bacterium]